MASDDNQWIFKLEDSTEEEWKPCKFIINCFPVSKINYHFTQIPPVKVEYSELPSIDPLVLEHVTGAYLIYSLMIVLSMVAMVTEVCINSNQRGKDKVRTIGSVNKIQVREAKPSVRTSPNEGHLKNGRKQK